MVGVGAESGEIVFLGALPIHSFRPFRNRMYRLATMHSVTNRQTDRRHYDANSRSQRAVRSANKLSTSGLFRLQAVSMSCHS